MGGEHEDLLRPRESDVVQPHPVEQGDAVLRLEGRPVVEGPEVAVDPLGARELRGKRSHHDHRKLEPLGLVDRHHLDVVLGEGLVGILVLVDATVVEQAQEAVEEVEAQELAVRVRDHCVVVVALEDVQELGEDREVAGGVFVAERGLERVEREQVIEVVGWAQVERFAFLKRLDLAGPPLQGSSQRMRGDEAATELDDGVIHVGRELGDRTANLPTPVAVPAKQHCETGDQVTDFRDIEPGAGAGAKRRDAPGLERGQVRAAVALAHAVQEQGHLTVIGDDLVLLQKVDEIGEAGGFVTPIPAPDCDDGRIVRMRARRVGLDGLLVAKGRAVRVGPVNGGHPAVVALDDRAVGAVVGRELDGRATGHALRELEDVAYGGPAEAVETLVLVADDAQVASFLREFEQELLLDVVGVLILVHEHVTQVAGHGVCGRRVTEQVVDEPLQVREVDPIGVE